jgi:predicted PurR-regulated permease PerM
MIEGKITFDRLARWLLVAAAVLGTILLIKRLSGVLLPFFVGWFIAYLLYPMVKFVQFRMHVRSRIISIFIAFFFVAIIMAGVFYFIIPPMIEQFERLGPLVVKYLNQQSASGDFSAMVQEWLNDHREKVLEFLGSRDFIEALKTAVPKVFSVLGQTASIAVSVFASFITLLYTFFILLDYEYLTDNWLRIFPQKSRPFWQDLIRDVERALNNYIRGQGQVAFWMGVMFACWFWAIGLPMPIGMGILIGIMDMVPYLHTFAIIPTAFLALLKAADTGQNFWVIFGLAMLGFVVVQVITDMFTTPKIMGSAMGLNPAVLLLSLSIWGALLGFIGLIIALPLTTLVIAYYKRYVTNEDDRALPPPEETTPDK